MDQQRDAAFGQRLQRLADLFVRQIADHKHRGQLPRGGQIHQLAVAVGVAHLIIAGRYIHAMVFQQLAVADQHPPAADPAGHAHILFIHQRFHRLQHAFVILDHPAEHMRQRAARGDSHRCRVHNGAVNAGAGKGLDPVQHHAVLRKQIARAHR